MDESLGVCKQIVLLAINSAGSIDGSLGSYKNRIMLISGVYGGQQSCRLWIRFLVSKALAESVAAAVAAAYLASGSGWDGPVGFDRSSSPTPNGSTPMTWFGSRPLLGIVLARR